MVQNSLVMSGTANHMVLLLQLRVIANPIVKIFVKCHANITKMLSLPHCSIRSTIFDRCLRPKLIATMYHSLLEGVNTAVMSLRTHLTKQYTCNVQVSVGCSSWFTVKVCVPFRRPFSDFVHHCLTGAKKSKKISVDVTPP